MRSVRAFAVVVIALSALAAPGAAAQGKVKNLLLPNATVKSVSATALVVLSLGMESTFTVDTTTQVVGKGIGTRSKAKGDKPTVADLLAQGDRVTVTYHEAGGTMRATKIEVSKSAAR
jgi:uncharacterized protein DUF5666